MINRLTGKVIEKKPPMLIMDVNGVGYELFAPMSTFYFLTEGSESTTLLTQLLIREDAHTLYAFATVEEKTLFQTLIKINGVGPKLALAILSAMNVNEFIACITDQNMTQLVKIPGVGKKTAERLLIEMKHQLSQWNDKTPSYAFSSTNTILPMAGSLAEQDAISALVALGYKPHDATKLIQSLPEKGEDSQTLIRQALRAVAV